MRVVRAWPSEPPTGKPHVVDGLPRVPVDSYDYSGVAGTDTISLDWDVACSREDLLAFREHAATTPHQVLVAPCRVYRPGQPTRWNLTRFAGDQERWCTEGEDAHHFGFGMVYLPGALTSRFVSELPGELMTDVVFAAWHHNNVTPEAHVDWAIRPVHLHYPEAETGAFP